MMDREPTNGRNRHFTLLELLLAVTLLLLMTTLLIGAGSAITSSWQKLSRKRKQSAELLKLDRILDTTLSNIVPFTWPDADGRERGVFRGTAESVEFVYLHRLNDSAEGALRFTKFQVAGGRLAAQYQNRPLLDDNYPESITRAILAENVERIELQYADWSPRQGTFWVAEWNREQNERKSPPLAVMIRVVWQDGRWESWLRRTAGAGQYERWGDWEAQKRL